MHCQILQDREDRRRDMAERREDRKDMQAMMMAAVGGITNALIGRKRKNRGSCRRNNSEDNSSSDS